MPTPNERHQGEEPTDSSVPPEDLGDRLDAALEAAWLGDIDPLEELMRDPQTRTPDVGNALKALWDGAPDIARRQRAPDRIGQYRIVRVLGEGGMGIVYEAEQEVPRRTVALKVIRSPVPLLHADSHALRLFQREAQTLARLEHPCIATIHEAGCTDEGRHFFAMELVRGVPLKHYVETDQPSTTSRLRLFKKICEAIHYAHQRGVIHRDLKPGNILVDENGNPKVLDFGLAKIVDPELTVVSGITEVGKIQGTLPYMSPEQARGDPVEVNLLSDVYALGVILYELLTDQLPYDVRRTALPDAVRVICEEPPHRLSTVKRALRGDLETITLKALEKDALRRYQSAAALADDIDRYLANQPILARPPTTIYQLRKLVARHRLVFGFTSLLFILVGAFAVWMSLLYRESDRLRVAAEMARLAEQQQRQVAEERLAQTERAQRTARTAARTTERINEFLQNMLAAADPEQVTARDPTVREVLDQAAQTIDTDLGDEPEVELGVRKVIGKTYESLGRFRDAELQFRAALAIAGKPSATDTPEMRRERGRLMVNLGNALAHEGKFEEAEAVIREGVETLSQELGRNHAVTIMARYRFGVLCWLQGRYDEAEEVLREVVRQARPAIGEHHRDYISTANVLALTLNDAGKFAEAEPLLRELLEWNRDTVGEAHPRTARAYNNLAWSLQRAGRYAEAESLYRKALDSWRAARVEDHPEASLCRSNLGLLLNLQGRFDESEAVFREALRIEVRTLGEGHSQTASSYIGLGWALHELGRHGEAVEALDRAHASLEAAAEASPALKARYYEVRGRGLNLQGRSVEAEVAVRRAMDISEAHLGPNHRDTVRLINELAFTLSRQGKHAEAEPLFRKALEAYRYSFGDKHPATLVPLHNVAAVLEKQGRAAEAEPLYRQVVELADEVLPQENWSRSAFHGTLGNCLITLEQYNDAEDHLRAAHAGLEASLGADNERTRNVLSNLVRLYERWQKPDQLEKYREALKATASPDNDGPS